MAPSFIQLLSLQPGNHLHGFFSPFITQSSYPQVLPTISSKCIPCQLTLITSTAAKVTEPPSSLIWNTEKWSNSVMRQTEAWTLKSNSMRPNTWLATHKLHEVKVLVVQLCLTLCDPMDCSLPGSSVHGILQARILEYVAIPFCKGSSQPRDQTQVSCIASGFFTIWATREAPLAA